MVVKLPVLLNAFVQTGVHVFSGAARFVLVRSLIVPAPVLVAENVRLLPEIAGLPRKLKYDSGGATLTTVNTPVPGLKL